MASNGRVFFRGRYAIKRYKVLLRILVSIVIILLLWHNINGRSIIDEISQITPQIILLLVVLYISSTCFQTLKWKVLMHEVSFLMLFKGLMYSRLFSVIMPGQMFGEVAKTVVISRDINNYKLATSSVVLDKSTSVIALAITGVFGVAFSKAEIPITVLFSILFSLLLMILVLILIRYDRFFMATTKMLSVISRKLPKLKNISDKVVVFFTVLKDTTRIRPIIYSILVGVLVNYLAAVQIRIICISLNVDVSIIDLLWVYTILSAILMIPISFAGIGTRDITLVSALSFLSVPSIKALSVSLVLLSFTVLWALIGGIIALYDILKPRSIGESEL